MAILQNKLKKQFISTDLQFYTSRLDKYLNEPDDANKNIMMVDFVLLSKNKSKRQ
jgi:hypothetical protein